MWQTPKTNILFLTAFSACLAIPSAAQEPELRPSMLVIGQSVEAQPAPGSKDEPSFEQLVSLVSKGELSSTVLEERIAREQVSAETHKEELRTALFSEVARRIQARDEKTSDTIDRIDRILGSHDSIYKRAVKFLFIAKETNKLFHERNHLGLAQVRDRLMPGVERDYVSEQLSALIHGHSKKKIDAGQPFAALGSLSLLDRDLWSDETYALVRESISLTQKTNAYSSIDFELFRADSLDALLSHVRNSYLGSSDRAIFAAELAEVYGHLSISAAAAGRREDAERFLSAVLAYRPNPNPLNSELVFSIAESARGDATSLAKNLISQLRASDRLSMDKELGLVFSGFYGSLLPISFVCGFAMLLAGSVFCLLKYVQVRRNACGVAAGLTGRFQAARVRGYRTACNNDDEQTRLLQALNVSNSSSLAEIRDCYEARRSELENKEGSAEELAELDRTYARLEALDTGSFKAVKFDD